MYMCEECNYVWDVPRSIGDPEVRQCPECGSYEIEETRPSNVPQGQANGRERSAYVQLSDVRALIEKIEEVQEIMDTAELSLISASSLDKMVEMVRIKNDLKQKLSEHFA